MQRGRGINPPGFFLYVQTETEREASTMSTQSTLTDKKKRFAEQYIIDMNATAAAIRAGYSDKTAGSQGNRLKNEPAVADYIRELAEQAKNNSIATAEEVLAFATKVKRGELTEQRVIGIGNGAQSIENFQASLKDRLAAATLLAKFHGILEKAPEVGDIVQTVVIDGSLFDDLEDEPEAETEADDVQ